MRHGIRSRRQEYRRAFDPVRWLHANTANEQWQWQAAFIQTLDEDLFATLPCGHQHEQRNPRQHRKRSALHHLGYVGGKEQAVDKQKTEQYRYRQHRRPFPQQQHDRGHQQGSHQHGPGHRHAVGGSQRIGRLEAKHQQDHPDHQRPVHRADVDLPLFVA
ncbi:hypothetical protein D3C77_281690 [compost metagenome]